MGNSKRYGMTFAEHFQISNMNIINNEGNIIHLMMQQNKYYWSLSPFRTFFTIAHQMNEILIILSLCYGMTKKGHDFWSKVNIAKSVQIGNSHHIFETTCAFSTILPFICYTCIKISFIIAWNMIRNVNWVHVTEWPLRNDVWNLALKCTGKNHIQL